MTSSLHKLSIEKLKRAKELGFSDLQIAHIFKTTEEAVRAYRKENNIIPVYKAVDTCAAEFKSEAPYYYSSYEEENEAIPSKKKKIVILGAGPNRIGQGIEFDYCCVRASFSFKKKGFETIMINCNPETVSTDYDISDKLYFEPLSFEDVMNVLELEKPFGVVISFGGQTPLKLSTKLAKAGIKILGTSSESIDIAENRKKFGKLLRTLGIPHPKFDTATNIEDAIRIAKEIGYPVLVRPSYVLGGRAMKIVYNDESMHSYINQALVVSEKKPILIDSFLEHAGEIDVDALSDGTSTVVVGIMRHIEDAGIHSGDSTLVLPPIDIPQKVINRIKKYTRLISKSIKVVGTINIQFAVQHDEVYVLEANPRGSRTLPFVCKATGVPVIQIACRLMLGEKISFLKKKYPRLMDADKMKLKHITVKEPVFPFSKFIDSGVYLGPEMRSTGEVMSFAEYPNFGEAFFKAELASGNELPSSGNILVSLNDSDKTDETLQLMRSFYEVGFDLLATKGTSKFLSDNGIECRPVYKRGEGRPDVADIILSRYVQFVINTPMGEKSRYDEMVIGASVVKSKVSYVTTIEAAKAAFLGIKQNRQQSFSVKTLQEYLRKRL